MSGHWACSCRATHSSTTGFLKKLPALPDMPVYPAAGCAGRVKLAAGWLIDKAGLKGYKRGRVGVHERQALVLVNLGGATGGEVIDFAHTVQMRVHEKFGIEIDTEVNIF